MSWWEDRLAKLKEAIQTENQKNQPIPVSPTCIHGELTCARCSAADLDTPANQHLTWHDLDTDDVKAVVYKLPDKILELMRRHPREVVVAGGFIRAVVANEPIRDLDIFISSTTNAVPWCREVGLSIIEGRNFLLVKPTIDYSHPIEIVQRYKIIDPQDIPEAFDYTIVKAGIWFDDLASPANFVGVCHHRFYRDITKKKLVYCSDRDEERIVAIPRLLKYTSYGYSIDAKNLSEVILKTCLSLDLSKGFEHALKGLEESYKPFDSKPSWGDITRPYVKPPEVKHDFHYTS